MKYLITGASGFLGSKIVEYLKSDINSELHLAVRNASFTPNDRIHIHDGFNLESINSWNYDFLGVDIVIHTAGLAHISSNNYKKFKLINTLGTIELAKKASQSGVKRFIYISSIKVNGDKTTSDKKFYFNDIPNPVGSYAISKYEAELGLIELSKNSNMEIVIIRPPLVYGYGVKGNFSRLLQYIRSGLPILIPSVDNKRSFISVDNLVDFIVTCSNHPLAGNNIFLVSDGEDLSTLELINKIELSLGLKCRLIRIPVSLLYLLLILIRKPHYYDRLLNSLQIDMSHTYNIVGWLPVLSIKESLLRLSKK